MIRSDDFVTLVYAFQEGQTFTKQFTTMSKILSFFFSITQQEYWLKK